MARIIIDYQDTINKAGKLEDIANSIKRSCSKEMGEISGYCNGVWKGDAADAYQKKLSQIKSKIMKRGDNLRSVAGDLEEYARRYQRIEQAANSIFS